MKLTAFLFLRQTFVSKLFTLLTKSLPEKHGYRLKTPNHNFSPAKPRLYFLGFAAQANPNKITQNLNAQKAKKVDKLIRHHPEAKDEKVIRVLSVQKWQLGKV